MLPTILSVPAETKLAISIFLATFAYEDGATLLAAGLAAAGRLDARLGLASAFFGIWVGDIGLYALGSHLGRRAVLSGWAQRLVTPDKLAKAEAWFSRRGPLALAMSRFLPGSRLPLYVTAGALRVPAKLFVGITGICSAIWVAGIFLLWRLVPQAPSAPHRKIVLGALALTALFGLPLLARTLVRGAQRLRVAVRKYRRWEFWPAWLFYPPVAAMCGWLALRYRGLALPTIANPSFRNGGVVGESKIKILQALMRVAPEAVADAYLLPPGETSERLRVLQEVCTERSVTYPFVLKPNVGQRGAGFRIVRAAAEAAQYLAQVPADIILQRYVSQPKEVGIFYYRFPGWKTGKVFAVTEKIFPALVGDGVRSLEQLINADPRASLIAVTYLQRFSRLRHHVLAPNERVQLVEAGNHCQGCIFRDGSHLLSDALCQRIDEISRSIPGFFIGRYDIRYSSNDELRQGVNFRIIELNGAASEATDIYDERNSLLSAYRTLFRQWELVYAIGRANRDRGHQPASVCDVWNDWLKYRAISAAYPAAD